MSFEVGMNFLEYRCKQMLREMDQFVEDVKENIGLTVQDLFKRDKQLESVIIDLYESDEYLVQTKGSLEDETKNSLDRLKKFLYNNRSFLVEKGFPRHLVIKNA